MDNEFKTTFIPKKNLTKAPEVETQKSRVKKSILGILAFWLFSTAVVSVIGVYLYRANLTSVLNTRIDSINRAEKAFETGAVLELKKIDIRLKAATTLLNDHLALSDFLTSLAESTLPEVSFSNLTFTYDQDAPTVTMAGESRGYLYIAQQSDVFESNLFIQNHIFSDFILTDTGNISFSLSFTLNKSLLYFGRTVVNNQSEIIPELMPDNVIIEDAEAILGEEGTNISFDAFPQLIDTSLEAGFNPLTNN